MNELEKALLAQSLTNADGSVSGPTCCGQRMADDGGCSEGCCDDYKCGTCGKFLSFPDLCFSESHFTPLNEFGPEELSWTVPSCRWRDEAHATD